MAEQQRFDQYLQSVLAQVPPGRAGEEAVRNALREHDVTISAIGRSSADVLAKVARIESARTSLMDVLHALIDTEQPEQPEQPEQLEQVRDLYTQEER